MRNGNGSDREPGVNLQREDRCQQAANTEARDGGDRSGEECHYDNDDIGRHDMKLLLFPTLCVVVGGGLVAGACTQRTADAPAEATNPAPPPQSAPPSIAMGGAKSVTRFFVTSTGMGRGGDLGGLAGADAYCQGLAKAEGE